MRIPSPLLCIFAVIIVLSACQKEFEDPATSIIPPASSLDTFRVDVDGVAFPTYGINVTNPANTINLLASDVAAVKRVALSVPTNVSPGSYPLDFSGMVYVGIYYPDTTNNLVSNPGTITIIENNVSSKRIRGTFDFNAQSLTSSTIMFLTNGYFSVKYH